MPIQAWIFDLDHCLFNTAAVGLHDYARALQKNQYIQQLGYADFLKVLEHIYTDEVEGYQEERVGITLPEHSVQDILANFLALHTSDDAKTRGSYGDEWVIPKLPGKKFLVTTGYRTYQMSKVKALGIRHFFDEVFVDARGEGVRRGKKNIFEYLIRKYELDPKDVPVVGDNPESELSAARQLTMPAIQSLRPTVKMWYGADYHVRTLPELFTYIEQHS